MPRTRLPLLWRQNQKSEQNDKSVFVASPCAQSSLAKQQRLVSSSNADPKLECWKGRRRSKKLWMTKDNNNKSQFQTDFWIKKFKVTEKRPCSPPTKSQLSASKKLESPSSRKPDKIHKPSFETLTFQGKTHPPRAKAVKRKLLVQKKWKVVAVVLRVNSMCLMDQWRVWTRVPAFKSTKAWLTKEFWQSATPQPLPFCLPTHRTAITKLQKNTPHPNFPFSSALSKLPTKQSARRRLMNRKRITGLSVILSLCSSKTPRLSYRWVWITRRSRRNNKYETFPNGWIRLQIAKSSWTYTDKEQLCNPRELCQRDRRSQWTTRSGQVASSQVKTMASS